MISIKEQALSKMLIEMNKKHTDAEDAIHNFLCDQTDEKLFEGIVKEDRTVKDALRYCANKAQKQAVNNSAMITDDEVYKWVIEYFKLDKVEISKESKATVVKQSSNKKSEKKVKTKNDPIVGEQLSLFEV